MGTGFGSSCGWRGGRYSKAPMSITPWMMRGKPGPRWSVTLSACETGLGKRAGGEGYLGFAQALFLAGARSVVLSLWPVDDASTALLMERFYRNLLGKRPGLDKPLPKAEALREAKRWLRELPVKEVEQLKAKLPPTKRGKPKGLPQAAQGAAFRPYEDPYFWAGFILIGDPD
jgi:CHAT domain-containing protein